MTEQAVLELLNQFKQGRITEQQAVEAFKRMPFSEDVGYAKIDHHRALRMGYPEVIFCPGKTPEQIGGIAARILAAGGPGLIATRANEAAFEAVRQAAPQARYDALSHMVTVKNSKLPAPPRPVVIVSAGTADMPVAEEAAITADMLGNTVERLYDVGVSGIHRLLSHTDRLMEAGVVIVVAGMEGALASVVGGLTDVPVVAVPTSVGYGASFDGLAALLAMLNSCAAGVAVMNIDNGFGAAWLANRINRQGMRPAQ